jgi:antitoxin VapB
MAGSSKAHADAVPDAVPGRAKIVVTGRRQTVRLPKEFRLAGAEVLVRRDGERLVLEPIDAKGWPLGHWARIDALAEGLDDDLARPADPAPRPIGDERDLP